ncbi:hypothetical protein ABPG74_012112 [Tetrahymena malaccensis]
MEQNQYTKYIKKSIEDSYLVKNSQESWNILLKGKHLTLSARPYNNSEKKILKIQGSIPASINQCVNYFFNNNESIKNNREQCEAFDLLEEVDQNTKVTVFKLKQMKDGAKRESLNVRHKSNISEKEVLIINAHLDEHQKLPKMQDVIRIETIINGIFLSESTPNSTLIEGYFLNDPKVAFPPQLIPQFTENFLQSYEKDVEAILKKI